MRCQGRTQANANLVRELGTKRCSKESTEEVGGYHFCWQHAKFARRILEDGSHAALKNWTMGK